MTMEVTKAKDSFVGATRWVSVEVVNVAFPNRIPAGMKSISTSHINSHHISCPLTPISWDMPFEAQTSRSQISPSGALRPAL